MTFQIFLGVEQNQAPLLLELSKIIHKQKKNRSSFLISNWINFWTQYRSLYFKLEKEKTWATHINGSKRAASIWNTIHIWSEWLVQKMIRMALKEQTNHLLLENYWLIIHLLQVLLTINRMKIVEKILWPRLFWIAGYFHWTEESLIDNFWQIRNYRRLSTILNFLDVHNANDPIICLFKF